MVNITIIGTTGSLGHSLREELENKVDYKVTLFSHRAENLVLTGNEKTISDSTTSGNDSDKALANQDIVFVTLSGNLSKIAGETVANMKYADVAGIAFVSSMGVYGEVTGEPKGAVAPILKPYHKAADIVERPRLDYTILCPGWFDNGQDSIYQIMRKGKTFYGHNVSRRVIMTLVKHIISQSETYPNTSLGLYR